MTFSKNWTSRKAVIAACHVPFLQELAEQTGIDSLSDAINFLIAIERVGVVSTRDLHHKF